MRTNICNGGGHYKNLTKYFVLMTIVTLVIIGALVGTSFSLFSYNAPGRKENTIITGTPKLKCDPVSTDTSGANSPKNSLPSNMIPVCYNSEEDVWLKADSTNSDDDYRWYSYNNKVWANAVTVKSTNRSKYLNANAGTEIPMDDINTMWVWIPRFKATGNTANYNGGTVSAPGAFNITFVNTSTSAHDAFTFGPQALNGFWMGKFELSHTTLSSSTTANNLGCSNNACSNSNGIIIKPNVKSLQYNNVSNFFYASLSMKNSGNSFGFDSSVDTHMIKSNEWGAVAYLTQSIYGRCSSSTSCTEIGINNNSSFLTGYGAPAKTKVDTNNGTYNTSLGKIASTTGNIYGVYDMSGGAQEYVMAVYNTATGNSGFSALPNTRYYNTYINESDYTSANLQHGLVETKGWYGAYSAFVQQRFPWIIRGGYYQYNSMDGAGIYNTIGTTGGSSLYDTRFILVK